jgi:hypothetical protein
VLQGLKGSLREIFNRTSISHKSWKIYYHQRSNAVSCSHCLLAWDEIRISSDESGFCPASSSLLMTPKNFVNLSFFTCLDGSLAKSKDVLDSSDGFQASLCRCVCTVMLKTERAQDLYRSVLAVW